MGRRRPPSQSLASTPFTRGTPIQGANPLDPTVHPTPRHRAAGGRQAVLEHLVGHHVQLLLVLALGVEKDVELPAVRLQRVSWCGETQKTCMQVCCL